MGSTLEIPVSVEDLTPAWLTAALRAGGVLDDAAVTDARYEPLGQGSGFIGQLARITPAYDRPTDAPATIVAKMPALEEGARQLAALYGLYEREYRFYRELASDVAFRTARCYYSDGDAASVRYVLLLEDMAVTGRAGDQVEGCNAVEANIALKHLAAHHAQWWNDPRLASTPWIQPGIDLVNAAMQMSYEQSVPAMLAAFGDRVPSKIQDALPGLGAAVTAMMEPYRDGPLTLAHGDYRLDNMFFGNPGSGYELAVLDWQSPNQGWGTYDVAYFLYSNLDIATRRACEFNVLREYHGVLVEHGIGGYPFDRCVDDYINSLIVSLAIWVVNAATLDPANERGKALFDMWFDRLSAAILDHDALSRLPA